MARPRNRPTSVGTDYFDGVTPLWSGPKNEPLPERYASAAEALADWAGAEWPDNEKSGFFPLRHYFVKACESWSQYDWAADEEWIVALQREDDVRPDIAKHARGLRLALKESAKERLAQELAMEMRRALAPLAEIEPSRKKEIQATFRALADFEKTVAKPVVRRVRYGPAYYDEWPKKLPKRETIMAIVLADLFTELRRDNLRHRRNGYRRKPEVTKGTPWKAIAEFVKADFDSDEQRISADYVQSAVRSHLPIMCEIQLFPAE